MFVGLGGGPGWDSESLQARAREGAPGREGIGAAYHVVAEELPVAAWGGGMDVLPSEQLPCTLPFGGPYFC